MMFNNLTKIELALKLIALSYYIVLSWVVYSFYENFLNIF